MRAFPIPYALPGRSHRPSLNHLRLVRPRMTASSSHFISLCSPCFVHFAPCYLPCFHTNTNCPICNSFVLITIQIAGGVGGIRTARVKASITRRMRVLSAAKDLSGASSDWLGLSTVSCRLLTRVSPLECAVTKKGGGEGLRPISIFARRTHKLRSAGALHPPTAGHLVNQRSRAQFTPKNTVCRTGSP